MRNLWNFGMLLCCWGTAWYWAMNYGGRSAWFCFYGAGLLFIYMGVGLWGMARTGRIRLRSDQTRAWSGEALKLDGQLMLGRGWVPSGWLMLEARWSSTVAGHRPIVVREVVRSSLSGTAAFTFHVPALPRGLYVLDHVHLKVSDAFGLLQFSRRATAGAHRLLVLPQPLTPAARPAAGAGDGVPRRTTPAAQQRQAASPFPYGTRPYTPGDPMNRIHWRSTARTGTLRAKETEQPEPDRLLVCVDAAGGRSNAAAFESALRAAGGLALPALQQGLSVRLAANDRQGQVREARGRESLPQLLELLAQLSCDGEHPVAALVQREALQAGAGIVVVTAQPDEQLLRLLCRLRPRAVHLVYIHGEGMPPDAVQVWRRQAGSAGVGFTAVSAARAGRTAEGGEGHGQAADPTAAGA
ncbi:DUF58 domain-containing protein [Paenibacillus rigui]|nr:DUF58 domain-containing protein [Paenibacillus rigui]